MLWPHTQITLTIVRILTLAFKDCHRLKVQHWQVSCSLVASMRLHLTFRLILVHNITVRVPINDKVNRDIVFPSDIPRNDFRDRIMAAMNLDPTTAQLGWKTNDEGKHSLAHQLITDADIDNAFKTITDIQKNPRRKKEIFMEVTHLVDRYFLE